MSRNSIKPSALRLPSFGEIVRMILHRPQQISTSNAMLWGIVWLIVGAIAGWHYDIIPATLFSYTWGHISLFVQVRMAIFLGLCSSLIFAFASLRFGTTSFVDVVARMLYARSPLTLLMLLGIVGDRVAFSTFATNPLVAFEQSPQMSAVMTVTTALIMIWYLYWSYTAYRSVMNVEKLGRFGVLKLYIAILAISFVVSVVQL
ncbi:MAG: hypothetical protein IKY50_02670 [Alistipes sp.]|nr:hypothetical protein [Alistipes sp.]